MAALQSLDRNDIRIEGSGTARLAGPYCPAAHSLSEAQGQQPLPAETDSKAKGARGYLALATLFSISALGYALMFAVLDLFSHPVAP